MITKDSVGNAVGSRLDCLAARVERRLVILTPSLFEVLNFASVETYVTTPSVLDAKTSVPRSRIMPRPEWSLMSTLGVGASVAPIGDSKVPGLPSETKVRINTIAVQDLWVPTSVPYSIYAPNLTTLDSQAFAPLSLQHTLLSNKYLTHHGVS